MNPNPSTTTYTSNIDISQYSEINYQNIIQDVISNFEQQYFNDRYDKYNEFRENYNNFTFDSWYKVPKKSEFKEEIDKILELDE